MSTMKRLAKRYLPDSTLRRLRRLRARSVPTRTRENGDRLEHAADVDRLERTLWLGYEKTSLSRLTKILESTSEELPVRTRAAVALGRWHMVHGDYAAALDHLSRLPYDEGQDEMTSLAADCLCLSGRGRDALYRLSQLLDRRVVGPSTRIRVGSAKSLALPSKPSGSGPVVEALNSIYTAAGLVPIRTKHSSEMPSLANLTGDAPQAELSTALVSVVIHARNVEEAISSTLACLSSQTWPNLEIVVVDDASLDRTAAVVGGLAELDPRIVLLENQTEVGEYRSRNIGFEGSRGELITAHGVQEWSHPQRIELQATALTLAPEAAATGSHSLRLGADFRHRAFDGWPSESLIQRNLSSLLLRRSAFTDIGLWDDVGSFSESELVDRLLAWAGSEGIEWIEPEVPLSIVQSDAGRDASDDLASVRSRLGALGVARQYVHGYRWWHHLPQFRSTLPYRPETRPRPFPPPPQSQMESGQTKRELGWLFVGELDDDLQANELLRGLAAEHPGEVGVLNVPGYKSDTDDPPPTLGTETASGRVVLLTELEPVHCRTAVILPSVLESPTFQHFPPVRADVAMAISRPNSKADPVATSIEDLENWLGTPVRLVEPNGLEVVSWS